MLLRRCRLIQSPQNFGKTFRRSFGNDFGIGRDLAWLAGLLFEPLCQFLVALSGSAHLLLGVGVLHGLSTGHDLFGACSQLGGKQLKLIKDWH